MRKGLTNSMLLAGMVLTIVIVDFAFFRNHALARLIVNIGIVLIFGSFYFRFLNK